MKLHSYTVQFYGKQYKVFRGTRNCIKRHKFGFRLVSKNIWTGLPWYWTLNTSNNTEFDPIGTTYFINGKPRKDINKKRMRDADNKMTKLVESLNNLGKTKVLVKKNIDYFMTTLCNDLYVNHGVRRNITKKRAIKKLKKTFRKNFLYNKHLNCLYHKEFEFTELSKDTQ